MVVLSTTSPRQAGRQRSCQPSCSPPLPPRQAAPSLRAQARSGPRRLGPMRCALRALEPARPRAQRVLTHRPLRQGVRASRRNGALRQAQGATAARRIMGHYAFVHPQRARSSAGSERRASGSHVRLSGYAPVCRGGCTGARPALKQNERFVPLAQPPVSGRLAALARPAIPSPPPGASGERVAAAPHNPGHALRQLLPVHVQRVLVMPPAAHAAGPPLATPALARGAAPTPRAPRALRPGNHHAVPLRQRDVMLVALRPTTMRTLLRLAAEEGRRGG